MDFNAVMRSMRERRAAAIAVHDSAERPRAAGVDVFFGTALLALSNGANDVSKAIATLTGPDPFPVPTVAGGVP